MRFLRVFLAALLLLILVVFAVANKGAVTVSIDPLPFEIELPLYLLVFTVFFAGLALGVIVGRLNAWSAARQRQRQDAARQKTASTTPASNTSAEPLPPAPLV
jgi:putative membrane protein